MTLTAAQARVLAIVANGPVEYSATATVKRTRRGLQTKGAGNFKATQDGRPVAGFSVAAASALGRMGAIVMSETRTGADDFDPSKAGSSYTVTLRYQLA